ncbi:hypothetical protein BDZ91DRAFT_766108 [Kalaharituber pfeilii]|nr:hypothetical protein BDZ91DRAFT_766108 [Kalaharituber pfeilii]
MEHSSVPREIANDIAAYILAVFKLPALVGCGVPPNFLLGGNGTVALNAEQWAVFQEQFIKNWAATFERGTGSFYDRNVPTFEVYDFGADARIDNTSDVCQNLGSELERQFDPANAAMGSIAIAINIERVVEVERERKYGFLADRDTIVRQWRNRHDRKRVRFFPTCWQQRFGGIQSPKPPDKFLQRYEKINDKLREENGMEDVIFPGKYQSYSCIKQCFRHTPEAFELGKRYYTAAMCMPKKGAKENQLQKQRRLWSRILKGTHTQPATIAANKILDAISGDNTGFRYEFIVHCDFRALKTENRTFACIAKNAVEELLMWWSEDDGYAMYDELYTFHPKIYPGCLATVAGATECVMNEYKTQCVAGGGYGLTIAQGEVTNIQYSGTTPYWNIIPNRVCRRQCTRLDEVELYNPAALRLRATRWIHALEQGDIAAVIEDILEAQGSWVEEAMKNCHDHSYDMYDRQMSRFH